MTKRVLQLRNIFVTLIIIETLLLLGLCMTLKSSIFLTISIYAIVKNLILAVFLILLMRAMEKDSLSVAQVLDVDARNALIYGGVGLVQYDENRTITWVSDLMTAMNVNIVGVKLLEWQPTLASLFENEEIIIINLKGRKFECYNSEDTKLIFLKDVTQYLSVKQDYDDSQMCVAYITVDNYDETLESVDEPKMVMIQAKVRQIIVDWAYENGMILRNYKSGGYLAFFNEPIYRKQVENKFSILDKFKEETAEFDEVMTLSMGIGRGTRILRELEQLASQALTLTYSRGGDQVAIKSGKDKVRYFGGNTELSEKTSKVRTRVISTTLTGLIKRSSGVLVMGHKNSDLDSLGGSLGIARIVQSCGQKVKIVLDMESLEPKTAAVVQSLRETKGYREIIINPHDALERVTKDTLLIVVDNHKPELAISKPLLEKVKNKVVIDHHRRGEAFIEAPILTYLEPSASSTVELLVGICDYQKDPVEISETDATIMYTGMLIDTNYFRQRVGVRTFQSAATLRDWGADVSKAYEILQDDYQTSVEVVGLAERAYRYSDDILISVGQDDKEYGRETLAKSSNRLLDISGINAAFTIGRVARDTVAISARSNKNINVQMIMELMGGGGHFTMAACTRENKTVTEVEQELEKAIKDYFEDRSEG